MTSNKPTKPPSAREFAGSHALILAAGVGRRLADSIPGHAGKPKIMLTFEGRTLLARHLTILGDAGVARVTVVVGYAASHIRAVLASYQTGIMIDTIENPDFREGSVVSLWSAREILRSGVPVILMDGDVLYDRRLMARLVSSTRTNVLLMDRDIEPGDEPVKLCVKEGRIIDFRKKPTEPYDFFGESVGFFRLTAETAAELADRCESYVLSGCRGMEYEEPIRDMIMQSQPDRFGFEDITGLPWTEIDFPEDVEKARALLPELVS